MPLLETLRQRMQKVLGIPILIDSLKGELPKPEEATRMRGKQRQWDTDKMLAAIRHYVGFHGRRNIGVIGITGEDLYGKGYNFLFGSAGKGIAVMSYCRFRSDDREIWLKRTYNQALSSSGLLFDIARCRDKSCPRSYPRSLAEHDAKSEALCPKCREGFTRRFGVAGRPLREKPKPQPVEVF